MSDILNRINGVVWSMPLVILVLISGLYYSIKLGFPQILHIKDMVKAAGSANKSEKGLNSVQSFIFTAARTVGVGNIAGMATGIYFGGPGAIFWLWILAIFGSSISMIEGILAQTYKVEVNGEFKGGPAYYMEKGMKNAKLGKAFAVAYAVITVIGVTFLMPSVQTYNIVQGLNQAFGFNVVIAGVIFSAIMGIVIFGGLKRIGNVAQRLSPIMAILYFLMSVVIIIFNIDKFPGVIMLIIRSAFGMDSVFGAMFGAAVSWGIKRGVYANEVGIGTSAITSASAEVDHPVTQGMIGGLSVFMGSFFVCTTSAVMILITNSYNTIGSNGKLVVEHLPGIAYGNPFVTNAINTSLPGLGEKFIAISILCFAFVALTAYYLYTESNLIYLIGGSKLGIFIQRIFFIGSVFIGSVISADTVWTMGDIANALMAWINVIAILFLGNTAVKIYKDYNEQKKMKITPVFDGDKLGLKNVSDAWSSRYNKK